MLRFAFCFMETAHEPLYFVRQMKFGTVKDHGHTYKFYFESLFSLTKLLNTAMVRNFEDMLGKTMNHS